MSLMDVIVDYLFAMAPYALGALPFAAMWRFLRKKTFKKNGIITTAEHEIASVLFVMFMAALISQTVITDLSGISLENLEIHTERINLIPFKEIKIAFYLGGSFFLVNFIGNLVMFLPIAFFTGLLYNKSSFLKCVLITAAFSVFVEVCQLPQDRGTDIDDVILNTLGGVMGYALYLIVGRIFPEFTKRCRVSRSDK